MSKTCEKLFHKNITSVLCKKPLEKTTNIQEMRNFENRPYCKGYSPCKGYSVCKMVGLGQKFKMPKKCEKLFHKNITSVLCKKPPEKTPNIREMRQFSKSAILQRLQATQRLQPLQNGRFGSKVKNAKNMLKTILQEHKSCAVQKTARKNTRYQRNGTIFKIGHIAKAIAHAKTIPFAKWSVWVQN